MLTRQLKYALRVSLKSPGFTLVAVATLAIGIAANTTVFSWIDSMLVRPLPGVGNGQELVAFETLTPNGEAITTSYADYRDYRDHLNLVSLAVAQPRPLSIGQEDHAERIWGELVSGNYFAVLGVKPVLGRVFSPAEYGDAPGGYPVAVISYGLWQRMFMGDRSVIGRTIRINRQQFTVVGVAPAEFRGAIPGLVFEVWAPAVMGTQLSLMPDWMMANRQTRTFVAIARLKPGVRMEQARAEIASVGRELGRMYPASNQGMSATVLPIWKGHFGAQSLLLGPLRILMAVCGVVLLIVCANIANLLLARAVSRQKEFGLRMALGAGRMRLIQQLLAESLVLAVMGSVAAIPLYLWMVGALGYLVPSGAFPIVIEIPINADILAFTILVCVVACVVSGVAPALHTSRTDLNEVLKVGGGRTGSAGSRSRGMRRLLVTGEVALALVAIIGAGLFARSFQTARRINPGFDAQNVLVSHLYLATAGYSLPERKLFCRRLRERLESQPGVVAATYADTVPLGFDRGPWQDLQVEGYVPAPSENMKIYRSMIAPGYFSLMRIPLLDGRDFTEHDDEKSRRVIIVNESFVRHFFAGRNPIGRRVRGWGDWITVVGVAKDSKYQTPDEAPRIFFYVPFRQFYREDLAIAIYVRTTADPSRSLPLLRREISGMDPNVGVFDAMPMAEFIGASLFAQKVAAMLLAVLGAVALVLAAVGMYSVMAYSITQRTQEIGIRMALGARPTSVLALAIREGMGMTAGGLLIGIVTALAVTRLFSGLLVNVSATDPLIFGGASLFLAAVALAASYIPARRATRVDPNVALRCE